MQGSKCLVMPWHPVKFLHKFAPPYTSSKNPLFCGMNQLFSYVRLLGFVQKVFVKIGCTDGDAETASRALVSADLRGIDSHGVARLSGYIRLWEAKRVNAKPDLK